MRLRGSGLASLGRLESRCQLGLEALPPWWPLTWLASKYQLSAADPRSPSHRPLSGSLNVLMMWTGFSRDERGEGEIGEEAAETARPMASSQKAHSIISTARFTGRESLSPARIRKRELLGSIFLQG